MILCTCLQIKSCLSHMALRGLLMSGMPLPWITSVHYVLLTVSHQPSFLMSMTLSILKWTVVSTVAYLWMESLPVATSLGKSAFFMAHPFRRLLFWKAMKMKLYGWTSLQVENTLFQVYFSRKCLFSVCIEECILNIYKHILQVTVVVSFSCGK